MTKRIITDDSGITGIVTKFDYDADKDEAIIEKSQDITGIIEANKAEFNASPERWGEFTKVGSIPMVVYYDLERRGILQDQKALAKWLNDPDNRAFRTRSGTI